MELVYNEDDWGNTGGYEAREGFILVIVEFRREGGGKMLRYRRVCWDGRERGGTQIEWQCTGRMRYSDSQYAHVG